ncbi:nucleotidyltransferase domain-containing protein [Actinopolyspora saharensis]|uniref:Nucleotidyltransferase domain-containing protein n=1 Tax=Actinopolyspora saharensis TaxID=995062 RepID=A0A1H0ZVR0_9ACTN|nr:nucleotidyltransferase domain-containing protein [Actinopolyspora saharensis]SDQ31565.1 Nucleotidyltransferase domain-containing protein [Actinopolyspora saharensis]
MDEDSFAQRVADRLAGLAGVRAVSLGGSRALGTHRADSDWDFAIYYRGRFDPQDLRDVGWPGEVSELGAWGGIFDGGAWLRIEERPVDVHFRDLNVIEHELVEARSGRFRHEPLLFHLAGIPSYLLLAELASNRVLRGELPRPEFPEPLREHARRTWWGFAEMVFEYARANHAPHGRLAQCTALLTQAAAQSAHAVLAARGEWITNEKRLLSRAGLSELDAIVARAGVEDLDDTVRRAYELCATAVADAGAG